MNEQIALRSYAKLNLGLHILGKRDDGYHEIRTVFQTIRLHDVVRIQTNDAPGVTLACNLSQLELEDNLIVKAVKAVCRFVGIQKGFSVCLDKQIPIGAGLGGGSSNAATAVWGLNALLGLRLSLRDFFEIGAQIGSDVPFFFVGGTAVGLGRGSEVYPLEDIASKHVLLVVPHWSISSGDAYGRASLRLTKKFNESKIPVFCTALLENLSVGGPLENDFEDVVFQDYPVLSQVKQRLIEVGCRTAGLTGSGSVVFGLFDQSEHLIHARSELESEGMELISTRTLSRREFQQSLIVSTE